jgi:predicted alpha/beta hydrolase family esterase
VTRQILFVQGGGKGVHDEWDNKLVESLRLELGAGYDIRYPRMPNEADPEFAAWRAALNREIGSLSQNAILAGHSIGGTILVNALAERRLHGPFAGLFLLAAPFIGNGGWKSDEIDPCPDLASRLPQGVPIFLYHGRDDEVAPIAHVDLYARALPQAKVCRLDGRDHQLNNDLSMVAEDIRGLP